MIHIKINDSIIDIVEKIEAEESSDIILNFPLGHPVLHNYISLKILKNKTKEKKLIIASNDRIGKKIGDSLGIEYSTIKNSSFLEENTKHKILHHNFTFGEYFKFQIQSYIREFKTSFLLSKKFPSFSRSSQIYSSKNYIHFFLLLLVGAFILFIFIYYFAINKSYIYISPEIIVKKEAHNFIFKENIKNNILGNNKYIKINKLVLKVESSENYSSTQIKEKSSDKSYGKILLYNFYTENQALVSRTRVQSSNGIIFELSEPVTIPAGIKDNFGKISPGSVEVKVISQTKDNTGNYVGSRGNIKKDSLLFLPGLGEAEREFIYAKSINAFSGGKDTIEKMISQKDIDNSRILFTEKLRSLAFKSLKDRIYQENIENNSQIDILSAGKSIIYGRPTIEYGDTAFSGSLQDSFQVSGSIVIYAYTYNKENIIQKLKTIINERNLKGVEKISHIDIGSLRMSELIYLQEQPFEVKANYEIEVLFSHDFLHQDNTYTDYLNTEIRGLPKKEAEKILLNDPTISNVEIINRPFFSKNISKLSKNIIFKIQ